MLLVGEGFDAGEFAAAQEFEGGAAAGGDVRDLVGNAGLVDGGYGIAAADDGGGAGGGRSGDGLGDFERAFGESGHFEDAHRTVPDDGLGFGDFGGVGSGRLGADVEAHLIGGRGGHVADRGCGVGFEFGRDDVVDREQELEIFLLGVGEEALGEVELVVFDERFADLQALRLFEGVGHAAADEHDVGDLHQVFDDFDLVADFCAADDGDEGPRGIRDRFADVGEFFFHQQAGGGLLHETRDADDRRVSAMSGAKGVADEQAVAKLRELLRESFVVLLFFRMEADVFEEQNAAVGERLAFRFGVGADAIGGESDGRSEQLGQLLGDRRQRIFRIGTTLRAGRDATRERGGHPSGWRGAASAAFRGCACRR